MAKGEFIKVTSDRYISKIDASCDIFRHKGMYYIRKNKQIVKWYRGTTDVRAAINFLEGHNYITATVDEIEWSPDDLEFVIENYGFKQKDETVWVAKLDNVKFTLTASTKQLTLNVEIDGRTNVESFSTFDELIYYLDDYYSDDSAITACIILTKTEYRQQVISAATNSRDLAKNLVRVKSSNIWAYGMNIRDRKDKTGDLVVQFKGKNGGPGAVYIYYDVPIKVWKKFITAPSKGHFHWANIRYNYWYRRLDQKTKGVLPNALN